MAFNLADLAEHTADAVPDRTALICGDRSVTFAELDGRANRLAHHFASAGQVGTTSIEQKPFGGTKTSPHCGHRCPVMRPSARVRANASATGLVRVM